MIPAHVFANSKTLQSWCKSLSDSVNPSWLSRSSEYDKRVDNIDVPSYRLGPFGFLAPKVRSLLAKAYM
jgi:hypothetical protein